MRRGKAKDYAEENEEDEVKEEGVSVFAPKVKNIWVLHCANDNSHVVMLYSRMRSTRIIFSIFTESKPVP